MIIILIITDLNDNIVSVWSGYTNSLSTIYPNNTDILIQFKEYHFDDNEDVIHNWNRYKIVDNRYELKTNEELNPPPSREEQIDKIKNDYQKILDNLIITKQRMEMLNQPVENIILAYQNKKSEMEELIRNVV